MSLKGKRALVTGAGRSLGRAIALRLAAEGADVAVNSRSTPEEIERVAAACREAGVRAVAVQADVAEHEGVEGLKERVLKELGPVDILVNNVGASPFVPFLEMSPEDWHTLIGVNLHSMFYCTRAFAGPMVRRGWGRILNITGHAHLYARSGAHTAAGKAGAVGFTRAIAHELAPFGVTCNHVGPGLMDTEPRQNKYYRDTKPAWQRPWGPEERVREVPVRRLGKPEELAALCAFLASEEAGYLTGQTFLVNGGMYFY
ncbi:MAG: SDR family NAD(P)-dependent oxidoreductase [Nitrospinota bacterium]